MRKLTAAVFFCMIPLSGCGKSDYSNCVVANSEGDYTGEWLQHTGGEQRTLLTVECEKIDRRVDGGDGMKKGKVRWAVCSNGPDCNEAGMF